MEDGQRCPFAICADHARPTFVDAVFASFLTFGYQLELGSAVGVGAMAVHAVVYVPSIRTCVMILSCSPVMRNVSSHCWGDPDAMFVAFAAGALITIIFVGIVVPTLYLCVLLRRRRDLFKLFHRAEYHGLYLKRHLVEDAPGDEQLLPRSIWLSLARCLNERITGRTLRRVPVPGDAVVEDEVIPREWIRFLDSDKSVAAILYSHVRFEVFHVFAVLQLLRLFILIAVSWLDSFTLIQYVTMVASELLWSVFLFLQRPLENKYSRWSNECSAIFTLMILGLTGLNFFVDDYIIALDMGVVLLSIGGLYAAATLATFSHWVYSWLVAPYLQRLRVSAEFRRIGFVSREFNDLFLNPMVHSNDGCNRVDVLTRYHNIVCDREEGIHGAMSGQEIGFGNTLPFVPSPPESSAASDDGSLPVKGYQGPVLSHLNFSSHKRIREDFEESLPDSQDSQPMLPEELFHSPDGTHLRRTMSGPVSDTVVPFVDDDYIFEELEY
jgi:hypothetical protein